MSARFFGGSRGDSGSGAKKPGAASASMRAQLKNGGKIDTAENYKKMLKQKLDEARFKVGGKNNMSMVGMVSNSPERSDKAKSTMQMMQDAQKAKEAKKTRKAVVVEAKSFTNGKIDAKGRVFDIAGNQVAQVNLKNGRITTVYGQSAGTYAQKSFMTKQALTEIINKNSPHLIAQRKLADQLKQQAAPQISAPSYDVKTDLFGNEISNPWGSGNIWGGSSVGSNDGWISSFFRGFFN